MNVRLIAATNRDLLHEVEAGRFRADLYHRLHVYPIAVPPLRAHKEDLAALAGYFLDAARHKLGVPRLDLHPLALAALAAYDWPGNVRELEHLLLRASLKAVQRDGERALLCPDDLALPVALQPELATESAVVELPSMGLREAVDAYQRQIIVAALARHGGNWTQAAQQLGLDRANLQRLAKRLGCSK